MDLVSHTALIAIALAYLLGAIPFGLLFARWLSGVDPREHGSGNIGATNAMRSGGKKVGVLTLLADIIKGVIPVALVQWMQLGDGMIIAVAWAAFLGHIFPIYLKFKGGKGVATMYGVLLPWMPWVAVGSFAVWFVVYKRSRYVSLASVAAGGVLPALAWMQGASSLTMLGVSVLGMVMILRHRTNIQRLLNGEEVKTV